MSTRALVSSHICKIIYAILLKFTPQRPHTHAIFKFLSLGQETRFLHFVDPRRFGLIDVSSQELALDEHTLIKNLGVEPLACDRLGEHLYQRSRKRIQAIKSFIMDAANVVGVGNIYASESLHRAAIHPRKAAGKVSLQSYKRLAEEIKATLSEAIQAGGTSFRDFCHPGEDDLGFEMQLKVYDRADEVCTSCKETNIKQCVIGGRSSYFCPSCQR